MPQSYPAIPCHRPTIDVYARLYACRSADNWSHPLQHRETEPSRSLTHATNPVLHLPFPTRCRGGGDRTETTAIKPRPVEKRSQMGKNTKRTGATWRIRMPLSSHQWARREMAKKKNRNTHSRSRREERKGWVIHSPVSVRRSSLMQTDGA
jgi:hypothetical protein